MRFRVNTTALTNEQMKFLAQPGEFRNDQTWQASCDPDEFQEAMELLKRVGIADVLVQFGEQGEGRGNVTGRERNRPWCRATWRLSASNVCKSFQISTAFGGKR
jgi:hypothetical protein